MFNKTLWIVAIQHKEQLVDLDMLRKICKDEDPEKAKRNFETHIDLTFSPHYHICTTIIQRDKLIERLKKAGRYNYMFTQVEVRTYSMPLIESMTQARGPEPDVQENFPPFKPDLKNIIGTDSFPRDLFSNDDDLPF